MLAEQLRLIIAEEGNSEDFWHAGLPCSVWRSSYNLAWAGYVGVNTTSPLHGVDLMLAPDIEVHGGITFSHYRSAGGKYWWFGFDCWHLYDICPQRVFEDEQYYDPFSSYRSKWFAISETMRLAEQIAQIESELND